MRVGDAAPARPRRDRARLLRLAHHYRDRRTNRHRILEDTVKSRLHHGVAALRQPAGERSERPIRITGDTAIVRRPGTTPDQPIHDDPACCSDSQDPPPSVTVCSATRLIRWCAAGPDHDVRPNPPRPRRSRSRFSRCGDAQCGLRRGARRAGVHRLRHNRVPHAPNRRWHGGSYCWVRC